MIKPAYIGYPKQQDLVVQTLTREAKRNFSGIFVVGGAGRVGKNTTIKQVANNLDLKGSGYNEVNPQINMYDECPDIYFDMWNDAYKEGYRNFVFGEIPVNFTTAFDYINGFYQNAKRDSNNVRILFNVISRNHPAWENDGIQSDIRQELYRSISGDLNLAFLSSDRDQIVKELWRFRNEGMGFDVLTGQLGFPREVPHIVNTQDHGEFKNYIQGEMEGNNSRRERW